MADYLTAQKLLESLQAVPLCAARERVVFLTDKKDDKGNDVVLYARSVRRGFWEGDNVVLLSEEKIDE